MNPFERLYSVLVRLIRPLLPLASALPPKVADAIEGRRQAVAEAIDWASSGRRRNVPLLWLHAASAGELGGAIPVIALLRRRRPELQLAVTVSSPSGLPVARSIDPDFAGYAPLDTLGDCARMIDALGPAALVFVKLDLWPGLSRAAVEARVPIGLINGTVRPDSSRLRSPTRQFLGSTYSRLEAAGVVDEPDAGALALLGVPPERIEITGDASFDQALARADGARASGKRRLPPRSPGRIRLLAGSTWPPDEDLLLSAAEQIGEALELVLVPHEPSADAVDRLVRKCVSLWGREPEIWSRRSRPDAVETDDSPPRGDGASVPLVVDAVGLLAGLYTESDIGFVGGATDATGLHSVIEPAAAGIPVLFGPVYDRREAVELVDRGAAEAITTQDATARIRGLVADSERRRTMGSLARSYVESGAGAAEANAELVLRLLELGISRGLPAGPEWVSAREHTRTDSR